MYKKNHSVLLWLIANGQKSETFLWCLSIKSYHLEEKVKICIKWYNYEYYVITVSILIKITVKVNFSILQTGLLVSFNLDVKFLVS